MLDIILISAAAASVMTISTIFTIELLRRRQTESPVAAEPDGGVVYSCRCGATCRGQMNARLHAIDEHDAPKMGDAWKACFEDFQRGDE